MINLQPAGYPGNPGFGEDPANVGQLAKTFFAGNRIREVAQPGSALRSGRRGRRFESCLPDEQEARSESCGFCLLQEQGEFVLRSG